MKEMISIIIPCRNEEKHIERMIAALLAQDWPKDRMEVFFVDGLSTDRTRKIIEKYADANSFMRLLSNPQKIASAAMNKGIAEAGGEVIIRMDAHTIYPEDYVSRCVEYLGKTGADNVGGPIIGVSDTYRGGAIAAGMGCTFGVGNSRFRVGGFEGYVDTVPFGAYRRDVFAKIGLFDEELIRNQDDELNYRLIKNGGKIYMAAEIKSFYHPRDSLVKLWRQYYEYGYWKVRVIQKHGLPASWRHIVPPAFVLSLFTAGVLALSDKRLLWPLNAIAGAYLTASLFFSLKVALTKGIKYLPILPFVFATLHIGYGTGFLKGVWDFLAMKKHRNSQPAAVTASSASKGDGPL